MLFRQHQTKIGLAILLLELALAAGCVYFAWRFVAERQRTPSAVVHAAAAPAPTASLANRVHTDPSPSDAAGKGFAVLPGMGTGLVQRLNQDDERLYQEQWKVINVLLNGIDGGRPAEGVADVALDFGDAAETVFEHAFVPFWIESFGARLKSHGLFERANPLVI